MVEIAGGLRERPGDAWSSAMKVMRSACYGRVFFDGECALCKIDLQR